MILSAPAMLTENQRLKAANEQLLAACQKVIDFNRQTALDQYGDADKAESWACVVTLRSAISASLAVKTITGRN